MWLALPFTFQTTASQRKSHLCIPFLEIAQAQSQLPHSCVSERLIYSQDRPHISCRRIGRLSVGIYKWLTDTWIWKWGLWLRTSFSRNICFKFLVFVLCSMVHWLSNPLPLFLKNKSRIHERTILWWFLVTTLIESSQTWGFNY